MPTSTTSLRNESQVAIQEILSHLIHHPLEVITSPEWQWYILYHMKKFIQSHKRHSSTSLYQLPATKTGYEPYANDLLIQALCSIYSATWLHNLRIKTTPEYRPVLCSTKMFSSLEKDHLTNKTSSSQFQGGLDFKIPLYIWQAISSSAILKCDISIHSSKLQHLAFRRP